MFFLFEYVAVIIILIKGLFSKIFFIYERYNI